MKKHIGLILAMIVFVVQSILIPYVGMSWDEPSSFFMGRVNVKFWTTGNRQYLQNIKDKTLFADSPIQYIYGEDIYPPFPFVVSSVFSYLLAEKLRFMNVFDAHHLGEVAIGSAGVWAMYGLSTASGLSAPYAVAATVAYALHPTIFGLMRQDAKDVPLVSMLTISSYVFLLWFNAWRKKDHARVWKYGILFALSFGLAESTKPTAVIFVSIALVWILISAWRNASYRRSIRPWNVFITVSGILLCLAVFVFFIAWPWLWDDPVGKLREVISFFKTVGYNMPTPLFGHMYHAGVNLPKVYPFIILFIQTPVEVSLLAIVGFVAAISRFIRNAETRPMLFVVWFVLGMGRFLLPGMIIYSWVRHFIDVMPAIFILSAFGLELLAPQAANWFKRVIPKLSAYITSATVAYAVVIVLTVHHAAISVAFFPYEVSYFNVLVGGTRTVAKHWLFDVGQASAVKEAMEYIARDSKGQPVRVYPCLLGHVAVHYKAPNVELTRTTEIANYTIIPNSPSWFEGALTFAKTHHEKAYTVKRAGADILYVLRYTAPVGWRCGWETISNYEY